MTATSFDCIVIGGGPAGLTAGIYLSRFLCKTLIIDNHQSRARLIPTSHNFPGQPKGISGKKMISLLRQHNRRYGTYFCNGEATRIKKLRHAFEIHCNEKKFLAKYVILATGVFDIEPAMPNLKDAIKKGLIRHCLICHVYEAKNQRIAVIGQGKKLITEIKLLKAYAKSLTAFNMGRPIDHPSCKIINQPILRVIKKNNQIIGLETAENTYCFDTVYSALGVMVRNHLAQTLNLKLRNDFIQVNKHQQTSVKGIYAIGDVVGGLNQMAVGCSEAAIAATHIFNLINS